MVPIQHQFGAVRIGDLSQIRHPIDSPEGCFNHRAGKNLGFGCRIGGKESYRQRRTDDCFMDRKDDIRPIGRSEIHTPQSDQMATFGIGNNLHSCDITEAADRAIPAPYDVDAQPFRRKSNLRRDREFHLGGRRPLPRSKMNVDSLRNPYADRRLSNGQFRRKGGVNFSDMNGPWDTTRRELLLKLPFRDPGACQSIFRGRIDRKLPRQSGIDQKGISGERPSSHALRRHGRLA